MHELSWKTEYEIGNPLVDREHKHLFDIALEAFKPVVPELRKKKIRDTIIKLNEYMKIHFKHEEQLMRSIEYPDLKEHRVIHANIIKNIQEMIASLSTLPLKEFEKNLAFFIDTALVGHILEQDSKIQRWYETKIGQRHIIHWSENFAIKNEEIDKDHKILFKIANDAFLMSQEGADKTKLKEVITKLLNYFKSHFEHEENFMREINYPRIEHHQKLHKGIIELTNRLLKGIPSMDTKTFELELALFVEKHLVTHIEYDDMKIKHFLNGDDEMSIVLDDM